MNKQWIGSFFCVHILWLSLLILISGCSGTAKIETGDGDRIAIIGNGLGDRMQHDGWLESYLHAANPDHELVIRNLSFTGDQVHHRPRAHPEFGDSDHHLNNVNANTIFAFFGYNESFDNRPEEFKAHLRVWIEHTQNQRYDGVSVPKIVLFSPIAHENLDDPNLPDGEENNLRLELYTDAMEEVAGEMGIPFVDLFRESNRLYKRSDESLTINGIHLTEYGNKLIAEYIIYELFGKDPRHLADVAEGVREAVLDKNWHWFNRYRATSGNDVWGSRAELHGNRETLQHELVMLDVMTANRDQVIWSKLMGEDAQPDDSNVPPTKEVVTNFTGNPVYLGGEEAIEKMTPEEGFISTMSKPSGGKM